MSIVEHLNFADAPCLKLAVSKGLGIGIITAASVVKVPQILKLVRSRSASGVSFLSYLLETASYLISLAYNIRNGFPFSTFGETAFILVQNVVITLLVLNYSGRAGLAAVWVATLAAAVLALGYLTAPGLTDLVQSTHFLFPHGLLGFRGRVLKHNIHAVSLTLATKNLLGI